MEFKPHGYQKHGIEKIIEIKKIGLFLEMGLGKNDHNINGREGIEI